MSYCRACGQPLAAYAVVCGSCGTSVVDGQTVPPPLPALETNNPIQRFVGQKYTYYQQKWALADSTNRISTWNWAAFIFGACWMVYRKMYAYSFLFLGFILLETAIEDFFHLSDHVSHAITIAINVSFGWLGNMIYRHHVNIKVAEITAQSSPAQVDAELARQGGTSLLAVFGVLGLLFGVIVIYTALTMK